jgi:hypothetical protein
MRHNSIQAAMSVLFPGNTEFKSQIALTSLLLPKDKTVTKDVLRTGTGVKYCLTYKNDPAEFTSSTLGVKDDNMGSAALQKKKKKKNQPWEQRSLKHLNELPVRFCMCQRA